MEQRQEVDNLMQKMDQICKACQDDENGPKDRHSNMDQILSIAEFMHQEYTDLYRQNEDLQNQVEQMVIENQRLVPIIAELEDQDTVQETAIQGLNDEITGKDLLIKNL